MVFSFQAQHCKKYEPHTHSNSLLYHLGISLNNNCLCELFSFFFDSFIISSHRLSIDQLISTIRQQRPQFDCILLLLLL